jgi:hypothetical protein
MMAHASPPLQSSSWWRIPEGFVPVAVSLGIPPAVQPVPRLFAATLPKALWGGDFTKEYRAILNRRAPRLLHDLQELRDCYGPLALCCWEHDPGTLTAPRCHRIVLADWLTAHGITVEVVA